jgi:hypothetical protein
MDIVERETRLDRRLDGFRAAVATLPEIAERLQAGQQFNAYTSPGKSEDANDDGCSMVVCLGPISDYLPIVRVQGRATGELIADALTFAALTPPLPLVGE